MSDPRDHDRQPQHQPDVESRELASAIDIGASADNSASSSRAQLIPAFDGAGRLSASDLRVRFADAAAAWLARSPSIETRDAYSRELKAFLRFVCVPDNELERIAAIRPAHIAAWRDELLARGLSNAAIVRKITVMRSLFSYLSVYGYTGANPAHSKFVSVPPVPRDGKTVGLTPEDCRRILDAPDVSSPAGTRDQALFAVLAYTGCRVGELTRLRVGDYKATGGHRVLEIRGKGGRERRVPLHPEAVERIEAWFEAAGLRDEATGPLFRPVRTARGSGRDGFQPRSLSRRAVQRLVARYVSLLRLDPAVTVHSFRVTALTTARERGSDIIDLQSFAGHADPTTTLCYIRSRDRLSKSPAYVLKY